MTEKIDDLGGLPCVYLREDGRTVALVPLLFGLDAARAVLSEYRSDEAINRRIGPALPFRARGLA